MDRLLMIGTFLAPLASAADTQGMYTVVPNTVRFVMSNMFVQYLVLYSFIVSTGVDPIHAFYFCCGMIILLLLERFNIINVEAPEAYYNQMAKKALGRLSNKVSDITMIPPKFVQEEH